MEQILEKASIACPVTETTLDDIVELERTIDSVKVDETLLPVFLSLLVKDNVIGFQLEQHYADYFGSQGLLR